MRHYRTDTVALQKLMIDAGFKTVSALAEASETDRNTLGKVINGKTQPSADMMDKLAVALKMDSGTAGAVFFCPELT